MKTILTIATLIIYHCGYSKAGENQNNQADVKKIIAFRLKMNPKTEFEKWYADQWTFAAISCAELVGLPVPKEITSLHTLGTGSFRLPTAEFCKALGSGGPTPQCFYLRATTEPFTSPPDGMPTDYVYMKNLVKEGTNVTVGGECNLVKDQFSTKQYFVGYGKVVWITKPSLQSVMTSTGQIQLNMGTISFEVTGFPKKNMVSSAVLIQ